MLGRVSMSRVALSLACSALVGACGGAAAAGSTAEATTPPMSTAEAEASADPTTPSGTLAARPPREALLPRPTELGLALTMTASFAVLPSGSVRVWGTFVGVDGDVDVVRSTPEPLVGLDDVVALAAGPTDLCALRVDGTVSCLSTTSRGLEFTLHGVRGPSELAFPAPVVHLALARWHGCAVLTDGRVACWGNGEHGAVGPGAADLCTVDFDDGEVPCARAPQLVPGIDDAVVVATGDQHTCALSRDGRVRCWGDGRELELGVAGVEESAEPILVEGIDGARELVAGIDFACASDATGGVWCWGGARLADAEYFTTDEGRRRLELPTLRGAHGLVAVGGWVCGVLDEHAVCAHRPSAPRPASAPTRRRAHAGTRAHLAVDLGALGAATRASSIALAGGHACLRDPEGVVHCWGSNDYGAVGDPWAVARTAPVPVLRSDGEPVPDAERPSGSVPATTRAGTDASDPDSEWYDYEDIAIGDLDGAHYPPSTAMPRRMMRAALARDAAALHACVVTSPLRARIVVQITLVPPDTSRARSAEVIQHDPEDDALVPCIEAALLEVRWPVLEHSTRATFALTPDAQAGDCGQDYDCTVVVDGCGQPHAAHVTSAAPPTAASPCAPAATTLYEPSCGADDRCELREVYAPDRRRCSTHEECVLVEAPCASWLAVRRGSEVEAVRALEADVDELGCPVGASGRSPRPAVECLAGACVLRRPP